MFPLKLKKVALSTHEKKACITLAKILDLVTSVVIKALLNGKYDNILVLDRFKCESFVDVLASEQCVMILQ